MLIVKKAEPSDVTAVQKVYRSIMDHLATTVAYRHWHTENHPSPEKISAWIHRGEMYIALDEALGGIAGVMVLNHEGGDAYEAADWSVEAGPDEVLIVHALGVAPAHLRRGVARFLVDAALGIARAQGCVAVRLDAFVENAPARELYTRCGFADLGQHTLNYEGTDLNQFHLYEYVL